MGTTFTQQGQYEHNAYVQLSYLNDENMMLGCTWPGKKLKLTCSRRGHISSLHKESACQTTERLIENQLHFQFVPFTCAHQIHIYFSNSVKKLKSKIMLVQTPTIYVTHWLSHGVVCPVTHIAFEMKGECFLHWGPIKHNASIHSYHGNSRTL